MSGKRYTEEFKIAASKEVAECGYPAMTVWTSSDSVRSRPWLARRQRA
jgi:hypothetical protein